MPIFEEVFVLGNSQWNLIKIYIEKTAPKDRNRAGSLCASCGPWPVCSSAGSQAETRTKNKNHSVNSGSFLLQRERLTLCWKILYQAACLGEFLGQWIESRMMNDSVKENSTFSLTWENSSIMKGREIGRKKKTSLRDFFFNEPRRNTDLLDSPWGKLQMDLEFLPEDLLNI